MPKRKRLLAMLLCTALFLSGCSLRTVDELYCLPKRSDAEMDLQAVIDEAMDGLKYSAPIYGENRQVTQKVDLDGDGVEECVVFAADDSEKPLKILIFCQVASGYVLMDTIEGYGFAFESVDFVQLDGEPGLEIVVGRQVSDDVMRSVSVYRFASARSRLLLGASCTKMLTSDLDGDGICELALLSSGASEDSNGILSVYKMEADALQLFTEAEIAQQAHQIKRAQVGRLSDGSNAIVLSSLTENDDLKNQVFLLGEEDLQCIYTAQPVSSLGGHFIFPEDLDGDGVLELPSLIAMNSHPDQQRQQYFVCWYTLDSAGQQKAVRTTYMNFTQGWYLYLEPDQAEAITVVTDQDTCTVYGLEDGQAPVPLLTVYALGQQDPETYTILYQGDTVTYGAVLEEGAARYGFTAEALQAYFYRMRTERNTEEN